jgi:hypothetical protein
METGSKTWARVRVRESLSLRKANMGLEDDLMKCTLQPFLFLVVISQEKTNS